MVTLVFAVQCVLVYLLSDKGSSPNREVFPSTFFRFVARPVTENEILTEVFASDPTFFVLPGQHGFSGMAWLKLKNAQYSPPQWDEPPRWLGFNPDSLGETILQAAKSSKLPPVQFEERQVNDGSELPLTPLPQKPSAFRVEGELRARFVQARGSPSAWPRAELLGDSVVQVAVNGAGDVVTCRLLPPGSGWRAADEEALEIARTARFRPRNDLGATDLSWGNFVFQWQTLPLPETDNVNVATEVSP